MNNHIPKIRFTQFSDEWEETDLQSITDYKSSGVKASDAKQDGIYPLYDANGEIGKTDTCVANTPYVSIIKDGSGVGRVRKLPAQTNCIGTMGCISALPGNDIDFIFQYLKTKDFSKHIISGAIPHIYFSEYGKDTLSLPSLAEQEKIGELFQTLDNLIDEEQKRLDKLRNIKAALLHKMFPTDTTGNNLNGGGNSLIMSYLQKYNLVCAYSAPNVPSVRFRGYTQPWQKKRLGDFGVVSMCKRVMKYQTTSKGEIPFYKIGTFGGTPDAYISLALFTELKRKYAYPQKGDVLLSAAGTIGRTVRYLGKDEYFQDSNIVWLQHNGKLDNDFLFVLYSTVKWNSLEGSTLKRLYNGNLLATSVFIPSLQEQQQIGNFFRVQDEQILRTEQYITTLHSIRTALLQKMFA